MRISVDENDAGYNPKYHVIGVEVCDGKRVEGVVTADTDTGSRKAK